MHTYNLKQGEKTKELMLHKIAIKKNSKKNDFDLKYFILLGSKEYLQKPSIAYQINKKKNVQQNLE